MMMKVILIPLFVLLVVIFIIATVTFGMYWQCCKLYSVYKFTLR